MTRVVCYTSFTYGYLSRARVLAQTLRAAHPDWRICALVVDKPPPGMDTTGCFSEFDRVVEADQLSVPQFDAWIFKHDVIEACTAAKGQMLVELLREGAEKVVNLDPDIAVFNSLRKIEDQLDSSSIVLTPHQVSANVTERDVIDNEIASMLYGVFNLGFLAVRNDRNGRAFANWWAQQLHRACYDDVANGIFTDQKYCDLVPSLFGGVFVERNAGFNVASWNLSQRQISFTADGNILVNSRPLRFYHFTKIEGVGDVMTDRYAAENIEVFEIWNWYKRRRRANEIAGAPEGYWAYGAFDDGAPIPKKLRVFYRQRKDLMNYFTNPFVSDGNSLRNWIANNQPELLA